MSDEGITKRKRGKMNVRRYIVALHSHENNWLVWKTRTMSSRRTQTDTCITTPSTITQSGETCALHSAAAKRTQRTKAICGWEKEKRKMILWNSICGTRLRRPRSTFTQNAAVKQLENGTSEGWAECAIERGGDAESETITLSNILYKDRNSRLRST